MSAKNEFLNYEGLLRYDANIKQCIQNNKYGYAVEDDGVLCITNFIAGLKLITADNYTLTASNGIHITTKEE